jgi:hypothetical protein
MGLGLWFQAANQQSTSSVKFCLVLYCSGELWFLCAHAPVLGTKLVSITAGQEPVVRQGMKEGQCWVCKL